MKMAGMCLQQIHCFTLNSRTQFLADHPKQEGAVSKGRELTGIRYQQRDEKWPQYASPYLLPTSQPKILLPIPRKE